MPCTRPIRSYRSPGGEIHSVTHKKQYEDIGYDLVTWSCGKCPDCKAAKSRDWGIRISHAAQMRDKNAYITLTYRDEDLPEESSLLKNDITKFFKTLRNNGFEFQYFQCGEYGEKYLRPHHHVILLGVNFDLDRVLVRMRNERPIWNSASLSTAWPYGNHELEEVNFAAGCYVAQYTQKKLSNQPVQRIDPDSGETWEVIPPYVTMSKGIATDWFDRYYGDVYPHDFVVFGDGQISRPPVFYDRLYAKMDPDAWAAIRESRAVFSAANDVSWQSLQNREYVTTKRYEAKIREPDDS